MEKYLSFENKFNYIDHSGMEKILNGADGAKVNELARNISVCLHEDWKQNLVREKGKEYQHWRPLKDAEFEAKVLANMDYYKSLKSEDGKDLFEFTEKKDEQGNVSYDVKFDLIRVPFNDLTKKWQEANLDAAKFALSLVYDVSKKGELNESNPDKLFDTFEKMSHDIHLEWMYREGGWADESLLLPYELLKVDTNGYNQKDKDRAHVVATTAELTFQPNILARNRSIVIRAINELFKDNAVESGLNPEIMKNLNKIQENINKQNAEDFARYNAVKEQVARVAKTSLAGKKTLGYSDLEKLAGKYYEAWLAQAKEVYKIPKEINTKYDNLPVYDARINHKNISRKEVKQILLEMVKEGLVNEEMLGSINDITNPESKLGKRIAEQNQIDLETTKENSQPT